MNIARVSGVFYLVCFVAGTAALVLSRGPAAAAFGLVAAVAYVAVTVLFFFLFKPVDSRLSLVAMVVSLAGIAAGPLRLGVNPLVFFGVYCLLIACLIFKSVFVPHVLAALLVFAGVGWLTFGVPQLSRALAPYNFAPGMIGEGALTLWLLFGGKSRHGQTA